MTTTRSLREKCDAKFVLWCYWASSTLNTQTWLQVARFKKIFSVLWVSFPSFTLPSLSCTCLSHDFSYIFSHFPQISTLSPFSLSSWRPRRRYFPKWAFFSLLLGLHREKRYRRKLQMHNNKIRAYFLLFCLRLTLTRRHWLLFGFARSFLLISFRLFLLGEISVFSRSSVWIV